MANFKTIICPQCRKEVGDGFFYDEDLNMICLICRKAIFAVTETAEAELKKTLPHETQGHYYNQKKEVIPIDIS